MNVLDHLVSLSLLPVMSPFSNTSFNSCGINGFSNYNTFLTEAFIYNFSQVFLGADNTNLVYSSPLGLSH